jgi:predicted nuclease of predicted toxin-antitoxin system
LGHDVLTAEDLGLSRADDADLLQVAKKQKRIFVTRDRDFGNLVFVKNLQAGAIYLRFTYTLRRSGHLEVEKILRHHTEKELAKAFVVVEPGRHRFERVEARVVRFHPGHSLYTDKLFCNVNTPEDFKNIIMREA